MDGSEKFFQRYWESNLHKWSGWRFIARVVHLSLWMHAWYVIDDGNLARRVTAHSWSIRVRAVWVVGRVVSTHSHYTTKLENHWSGRPDRWLESAYIGYTLICSAQPTYYCSRKKGYSRVRRVLYLNASRLDGFSHKFHTSVVLFR